MSINPFLQEAQADAAQIDTSGATSVESVKTQLLPSPGFAKWLAGTGGSLAFTTYQSGRLFFLGARPDGSLYALHRMVGPAMGMALDAQKLWLGCRDQIWRFTNTGAGEVEGKSYDAIYMPRQSNMVGLSDTHDLVADVRFNGQHYDLLYANTRMSCIAAPDAHYNFRPVWQPDFITELMPEDRCHLNGLGVVNGELAYATICAKSNEPRGWKPEQVSGGFVIDLRTNTIVCERLSMPHSPRWRPAEKDARGGKLWILNSGEGELGYLDFTAPTATAPSRFVPVAQCTGFARGLAFVGDHAVVGLSRLREKSKDLLSGMPLAKLLQMRGTPAQSGLQVFDTKTGALAHSLTIEGSVAELYDVAFLPGFTRPFSPGFRLPDLQRQRMNWPVTQSSLNKTSVLPGESS
jgi:uncharacterized protein (TIGR03032 family)